MSKTVGSNYNLGKVGLNVELIFSKIQIVKKGRALDKHSTFSQMKYPLVWKRFTIWQN
jgi:hypothetical protein